MRNLEEKVWKKFEVFGENGFLQIVSTSSSVDSIRLKEGKENIVPYITRSDVQNGVAKFVSENNYEFGSDEAGSITVGLDTQTAFYQPHRFITGQNIHIVTGVSLNRDIAPFYVTILRKQMEAKFNWGGNGATLGRMRRLNSLLPVNENGECDFQYMEEYARNKRDAMIKKYRVWLEMRIADLGDISDIEELGEKEWKPIAITSIFERLVPGKGKGLNHLIKTNGLGINYIGATNRNNGVLCYIENNENAQCMVLSGNCIGFIKNGDGSAGYAIYKAESFISTSDVIYGYASWLNKFTGLFFVAAQDMIEQKYSHGYKRNRQHLEADKVMLPVNDDGAPDFDYMEQYAKNLMLKKYQQYLAFLETSEKY